jgi:hypothetical protein
MKTCSVEGCTNPLFGKHFCKFHYPKSISKKPLSKSKGFFISPMGKKQMEIIDNAFRDAYMPSVRDEFFNRIWKKRKHISEVSGVFLGDTPNSMFFHHILPKRLFKEAEFDEENIILLTPEEHANVESNIYRYEEINKRREFLKKKYNIL